MEKIWGNATCALIAQDEPDRLYLFASGNPLYLAYEKNTDIIYFASSLNILQDGLVDYRVYRDLFHEPTTNVSYLTYKVEDDTGLILTKNATEFFGLDRETRTSYYSTGYQYGETKTEQQKLIEGKAKKKEKQNLNNKRIELSNVNTPIERPSSYTTNTLARRLDYLIEWIKEGLLQTGQPEYSEFHKIKNTLVARYERKEFNQKEIGDLLHEIENLKKRQEELYYES